MAEKNKPTDKKETNSNEQLKKARYDQLKTQIQMLNIKQDENMTRVYTAFRSFR